MQKQQINTIKEWYKVDIVFTKYDIIWSPSLGFKAEVDGFRIQLNSIAISGSKQTQSTKSATDTKKNDRTICLQSTLLHVANGQSYARSINDQTLYGNLKFTKSELERMTEVTFISTLILVHDTLAALPAASVAPYFITPAILTTYQTQIDTFRTAIPAVTSISTTTIVATQDIANTIKSGNFYLNETNKLILNYEATHPDFVKEYRVARRITRRVGKHHIHYPDVFTAEGTIAGNKRLKISKKKPVKPLILTVENLKESLYFGIVNKVTDPMPTNAIQVTGGTPITVRPTDISNGGTKALVVYNTGTHPVSFKVLINH